MNPIINITRYTTEDATVTWMSVTSSGFNCPSGVVDKFPTLASVEVAVS